ncbi:acyltransferase [Bacillus sp. UNC438CL73TsuS30]|uniref:acyltransferase n=1 Tax=Bacillus sp. UNC438CL73TsuS30 TaxID=1340434 RepID=UPI000479FAB7|nr:acyltransferase family protein [Bacillus sp. UNC438CL73TsuS30]
MKKVFFGIDLLKMIAIIAVPSVHFLLNTHYYSVKLNSPLLYIQTFYRQIFIVCVPLFIMATGFLQWKKEWNKKYLRGVLNIFLIYVIYSVFAIIIRVYQFGEQATIAKWISMIFSFKAVSYSWYVNMYIGLALIIPFLNVLWQGLKTKRQFEIFLLVLFFVTGIPMFWNGVPALFGEGKLITFPYFWMTVYPLFYYFMGVYIREYNINMGRLKSFSLFLIITLLEVAILIGFNKGTKFINFVGGYGSALIMLQTTFLFLFLYQINPPKNKLFSWIKVPIHSISTLTLDIYLVSYVTDRFVYRYFMNNIYEKQDTAILYAPAIVISTFTMAYVISLIRQKIISIR